MTIVLSGFVHVVTIFFMIRYTIIFVCAHAEDFEQCFSSWHLAMARTLLQIVLVHRHAA